MGWARRTKLRETSGMRCADIYKTQLHALFDVEGRDNLKKLCASGMREYLVKNYPGRFDIPSETFIQNLSLQCSREKKGP